MTNPTPEDVEQSLADLMALLKERSEMPAEITEEQAFKFIRVAYYRGREDELRSRESP